MGQDPDTIIRVVRYVRDYLDRFVQPVPQAKLDEVTRDVLAFAARAPRITPNEHGIVSLLKPKTAALAVDRVFLQFPGQDPRLDFGFGWESLRALRLAALSAFFQESLEHFEPTSSVSPEAARFVDATDRMIAEDYSAFASVAPLYASATARDADYQPGRLPVIVTLVQDLAVVSEDSLTWDQVLEFRRDTDARTAYRRFVHWLDREMVGRSATFIVDEVAARMEKYHWALRKHGLQTIVGSLARTLDAQQLLGVAATALTVQALAQQPLLSVLSGAGIVVGKAAVSAAATMIDRRDIQLAHRDIAFVHEIQKAFGAHE